MQIQNANPPIQVTGRHVSVTDAMKEYCQRRLACLHLDYPKIIEVQVILDVEKYRHTAEVILHCSNHITLEASSESDDMYASIDEVVDKIARQMRKLSPPVQAEMCNDRRSHRRRRHRRQSVLEARQRPFGRQRGPSAIEIVERHTREKVDGQGNCPSFELGPEPMA